MSADLPHSMHCSMRTACLEQPLLPSTIASPTGYLNFKFSTARHRTMSEHDSLKQLARIMHEYFKARGGLFSLSHIALLATLLSLVAQELEDGNPRLLTATDQVSTDLATVIDHANKLCQGPRKLAMCDPWTQRPDHTARIKENVRAFMKLSEKSETKEAQIIKVVLIPKCQSLLKHAYHGQASVATPTTREPPDRALIELHGKTKSRLLQGLRLQEQCSDCTQMEGADRGREQRHHVRLLLNKLGRVDDGGRSFLFDAIVSPPHMKHWQEIALDLRHKKRVEYLDHTANYKSSDQALRVYPGDVCNVLRDDTYVRIQFEYSGDKFVRLHDGFAKEYLAAPGPGMSLTTVLQLCKLQVKEKIALGHLIALAFWQFYDTEILHDKWTSERILFMPESTGWVPNKPCISFKSIPSYHTYDERLNLPHLGHRYPRLLALAIILIEIGSGRPLQLHSLTTTVSQINANWQVASDGLKLLNSMDWEGFSNKDTYLDAVRNCLQSKDYDINPVEGAQQDVNTVAQRKNIIYNKVVWPLQLLLESGYRAPIDDAKYFEFKSTQSPDFATKASDIGPIRPIPPLLERLRPPVFHGTVSNPKAWLQDLAAISKYVHLLRRRHRITRKIKVAILDTGCHLSAAIFQRKPELVRKIMGWKDYISDSERVIDSHGHGTFMAGLLLESAPIADLYLARVALGMDDLARNTSIIATAIRWAALEEKVDIISMSFGFSKEHPVNEIDRAIVEVLLERENKVIFLSSAGNFGSHQDETFPAQHPSVISMRATTPLGSFLNTNPNHDTNGPIVLGTIGDMIPPHLQEYQPHVCKSGTSAATVVAAGVAALVLAYATVLPTASDFPNSDELRDIWTLHGMKKILQKMSDSRGNRQWFLNPVKFFLNNSEDRKVFMQYATALCD